jgi:CheY-like chemotaxis protein
MSHHLPILVVEDSDDQVFILQLGFKKAEILDQVQVASTGEEAIAYLAGTGRYSDWDQYPLPSMVLLDLKLPGISGFEVLKWIRQQPSLKTLRVAMLTSSDMPQEIQHAYELGVNTFLTKPVDLDKLVEMIKVLHAHWVKHAPAPEVSRVPQTASGNHPS